MQSDYLPFFFDRIDDFDGIRISYAACSPKSKAPIYNRAKITKLLGKFADISVRDMNTKSLVSNLGYTSANLVADPTQLYDFTECLDSSSDNIPDKYIFSYIIGTPPKEGHEAYYQHIYSIYGELPIIGVRQNNASYLHHTCMYRDNISPFEWVHMIKNATVVYTDSFHAILFAIKFKIPFIAYYKEHLRASRLVFLKEYYNLDGFIVNKLKDAKIQITPDWKTINVQEQLLVNHSLKFLKRNL